MCLWWSIVARVTVTLISLGCSTEKDDCKLLVLILPSDVEKGDLEVRSAEAPEDCGEWPPHRALE